MTYLHRNLLICFWLGLSGPALAEREVHVVAVGHGDQTKDFYALPEARVSADRPGQDISLVLLDDGQIHWKVEATTGTVISEIVRSGPSAVDSRISLSGISMGGVDVSGLPLVFHPWGRDFRTLVDTVTDTFGTRRIHSFQGANQLYEGEVRIDHVDMTTVGLARDYLAQLLVPSGDLPLEIRNWIANRTEVNDYSIAFDENGISLTGPTGTQRFPVTAGIPKIVLPIAGVYDPGTQMIYCITLGGEGYIYSVEVQSEEWDVVTSLNGYDPAGLFYDPDERLLITTGAFSRPGSIRVFGLDGTRSATSIPTTDFPGLTDLFDYGNAHGPPLTPHAYRDGWLLVEAVADGVGADPDARDYRIYAVQIASGEVRLLSYRNN